MSNSPMHWTCPRHHTW